MKAEIGAWLEMLAFPPVLGRYEVSNPRQLEPGSPGVWRPVGTSAEAAAVDAGSGTDAHAVARHPALLSCHQGTTPWLLAKALLVIAEVQPCLDSSRALTPKDLWRMYRLYEYVTHARVKLAFEDTTLRGERDLERRRQGGKLSGQQRGALHAAECKIWRAEADGIWERNPRHNVQHVASRTRDRLERDRQAGSPSKVPALRTIWGAIKDLDPKRQATRRAK